MRTLPRLFVANRGLPLAMVIALGLSVPLAPRFARAAKVEVGECARLDAQVPAGRVRLLDSGAPADPAHRVLGVLTLEAAGPSGLRQPTAEYWASRFRPAAGRLGADALAGLSWTHFAGEGRYFATVLAVGTRAKEVPAPPCERVIALEPIRFTTEAPPGLRARDEETLRIAIGYALGQRGYFVLNAVAASSETPGTALAAGRLTLVVEPAGDRAAGQGGPVRLRGTLASVAGVELWSGSEVEEFQDLADITGAVLFGSLKSRSGRLLAAVQRLTAKLPDATGAPAVGASSP